MRGLKRAQWVRRDWRASHTIADFTTSPLGPIQRVACGTSPGQHNTMSYRACDAVTRKEKRKRRVCSLYARQMLVRINPVSGMQTTSGVRGRREARIGSVSVARSTGGDNSSSLHEQPEDKIPAKDDTSNVPAKWTELSAPSRNLRRTHETTTRFFGASFL